MPVIFTLSISLFYVPTSQSKAVTTYEPLGVANDFNIFVFNNHTQMNSDSEGRAAAGNTAHYTNYDIGDKLTISTERYGLIVGQSLYAKNGSTFNGNTAIGINGTIEKYTMTNNNGQQTPDEIDWIDFEVVYNHLMYKSSNWSQLPPKGIVEKDNSTLTLRGDDSELNIFALTTEELTRGKVGLINLIVPDSSAVLMIVSGTELSVENYAMKKDGGDLDSTNGRRILWNFPALTTLDLDGFNMVGSLLAPKAVLTPSGWGQIDGSVVVEVNSDKKIENEFENHPIEKEITIEPSDDNQPNKQVSDSKTFEETTVRSEPSVSKISAEVTLDSKTGKYKTSKGKFIDGLPQTGDTFIRFLIALGGIFIVAGIIFLTKRAKRQMNLYEKNR